MHNPKFFPVFHQLLKYRTVNGEPVNITAYTLYFFMINTIHTEGATRFTYDYLATSLAIGNSAVKAALKQLTRSGLITWEKGWHSFITYDIGMMPDELAELTKEDRAEVSKQVAEAFE